MLSFYKSSSNALTLSKNLSRKVAEEKKWFWQFWYVRTPTHPPHDTLFTASPAPCHKTAKTYFLWPSKLKKNYLTVVKQFSTSMVGLITFKRSRVFLPPLSLSYHFKWKRSLKNWKREINAQMSCLYCAVHVQSLSSIRSSISYLSSLNLQPSRNRKICNMATRLAPLGVRNHLDNVHNFCRFSFVLSLLRLLSETS